jgi:protein-disulfide isomerase
MKRNPLLAGAVALAVFGGFWAMTRGTADPVTALATPALAQEATATSEASRVPDMVLGKQDAPVTVVEYASFTCPHCANFHDTVFDKMKANYIDTGKVRFVYREVYFDRYGLLAAMIARQGGPEKYFAISDILYDTQKEWLASGEDAVIVENLKKIGLKAGLDQAKVEGTIKDFETCTADLNACMATDNIAGAMVATYQANAQKDGVEGTPTFLINGEKQSGAMSYEEFSKLLDAKLEG